MEKVKQAIDLVNEWHSKVILYADSVACIECNGYLLADQLNILVNADPLTRYSEMLEAIRVIEARTNILF